jgi:O-acetyl-ADP-ribose deacetylase
MTRPSCEGAALSSINGEMSTLVIFAGDLTDAPAEVLCTSTNPRLTLVMGTGAAVRERGGYSILRECEAILSRWFEQSGRRELPPGSVHRTAAGSLPARMILHCVASDQVHRSSAPIIISCVERAMIEAKTAGCRSVALPLFGTGHARISLRLCVESILAALRRVGTEGMQVYLVAQDEETAGEVQRLAKSHAPDVDISIERGPDTTER